MRSLMMAPGYNKREPGLQSGKWGERRSHAEMQKPAAIVDCGPAFDRRSSAAASGRRICRKFPSGTGAGENGLRNVFTLKAAGRQLRVRKP